MFYKSERNPKRRGIYTKDILGNFKFDNGLLVIYMRGGSVIGNLCLPHTWVGFLRSSPNLNFLFHTHPEWGR